MFIKKQNLSIKRNFNINNKNIVQIHVNNRGEKNWILRNIKKKI